MASNLLKGTINAFETENTKRVISYNQQLKSFTEQRNVDYYVVASWKKDPSNLQVCHTMIFMRPF